MVFVANISKIDELKDSGVLKYIRTFEQVKRFNRGGSIAFPKGYFRLVPNDGVMVEAIRALNPHEIKSVKVSRLHNISWCIAY